MNFTWTQLQNLVQKQQLGSRRLCRLQQQGYQEQAMQWPAIFAKMVVSTMSKGLEASHYDREHKCSGFHMFLNAF